MSYTTSSVNVAGFNLPSSAEYVRLLFPMSVAGDVFLPAPTTDGQEIILKDSSYNAATNKVKVKSQGTGATVDNGSFVGIDKDGGSLTFVANATANNWELIAKA